MIGTDTRRLPVRAVPSRRRRRFRRAFRTRFHPRFCRDDAPGRGYQRRQPGALAFLSLLRVPSILEQPCPSWCFLAPWAPSWPFPPSRTGGGARLRRQFDRHDLRITHACSSRHLHSASRARRDDDLRARRRGRRLVLPPGRRSLPGRRSAERDGPHDPARRIGRRDRDEVSDVLEEAVNRVEGIDELRSISAPGQSMVIVTFNLNRDIDTAAQDVRDRVAPGRPRSCRDDVDPPIISSSDNDSSPVLSIALSGNLSIRELTEIADKIVKVHLERSNGVGEVQDRRRARARDQHLGRSRSAGRLPASRSPRCATRCSSRTPTCPAETSPAGQASSTLRTMGRFADADAVQRPRDRHASTARRSAFATSAAPRTAPRSSVDRAPNGVPTVSLEIRRQSGANTVAVIEAVKANLERVQRAAAGRT